MQSQMPFPLRGAIASMTENNVIGLNGQLPWYYSEDFKRFKQVTLNSIVVMGRLTWESINQTPLPQRKNIVISRGHVENIECYSDLNIVFSKYKEKDIWVIGGGQIYRAALPFLNLLDITYVPDKITVQNAVMFPDIDRNHWQIKTELSFPNSPLQTVIYKKEQHN